MDNHRFVFAGAAHLDNIGVFDVDAPAGLSTPGRMTRSPGGAALNTARVLRALCFGDTVFNCSLHSVGKAGANPLHDLTEQEGIALQLQQPVSNGDPSYTALLQPDGSVVAALADMNAYAEFDARAVTCGASDWLILDANLSSDCLAVLGSITTAKTVAIAVSSAKVARLRSCLANVDLLFCNRAEASVLAGSFAGAPDAVSWDQLSERLRRLEIRQAVITDGAGSICVLDGDDTGFVNPVAVSNPISVVGAGDTLTAGTLAALSLGTGLMAAVGFGAQLAGVALRSAQAVDPVAIRAQSGALADLALTAMRNNQEQSRDGQ
ncbi:MAG: PfkB family carbohydrate kinase [Pseudomonadota bacterium]